MIQQALVQRAVKADEFVGTDTGIGRDISARVRDAHVREVVTYGVAPAFNGCRGGFFRNAVWNETAAPRAATNWKYAGK
jgi:hypothetical protein